MNVPERLTIIQNQELKALSGKRVHETRLGEELLTKRKDAADLDSFLSHNPQRFVVMGIPEDIGVMANMGIEGARHSWSQSLPFLLRCQANRFTKDLDFTVLGEVNCDDLLDKADKIKNENSTDILFEIVEVLDQRVSVIIQKIVAAGRVPIVVGGGHNNAYPILKGSTIGLKTAKKLEKASINCINIDAHADCRPMEGRHSGNGFTYALYEGFLNKYHILGLQENYITEGIEKAFKEYQDRISFTSFESLCVRKNIDFIEIIKNYLSINYGQSPGLELDMDCITSMPSSAYTSVGFSVSEVLQIVHHISRELKPSYFHITEAAVAIEKLPDGELKRQQIAYTGKAISSLILEFIKSYRS